MNKENIGIFVLFSCCNAIAYVLVFAASCFNRVMIYVSHVLPTSVILFVIHSIMKTRGGHGLWVNLTHLYYGLHRWS